MYLGVFRLCQPHKVFAGIVVDPVLEVYMMNHKVIFHAPLFVAGLFQEEFSNQFVYKIVFLFSACGFNTDAIVSALIIQLRF